MDQIRYLKDNYRPNDEYEKINGLFIPKRGDSKVEFFNDATGERIWEPLHNKTVVAGSALTAMKLFDLDRNALDKTPTYDNTLNLLEKPNNGAYPVKKVYNSNNKSSKRSIVFGLLRNITILILILMDIKRNHFTSG